MYGGIGKESFTTSCCRLDSSFCQQFERLCQAERKRPELIIKKGVFHHDRQRQTPHTFDNSLEPERTWLGSFDASTL